MPVCWPAPQKWLLLPQLLRMIACLIAFVKRNSPIKSEHFHIDIYSQLDAPKLKNAHLTPLMKPKTQHAAERSEAEGLFYRFKVHMRLIAGTYSHQKTLSGKPSPRSAGGSAKR